MIRPARREELETCAAVVRESFATVAPQYGITRESAPRHTSFLSADRLREQYARGEPLYVYELRGRIVGYCSLSPGSGPHCRELNHLAVLPACRHQGVGRALVQHAVQQARALGCTRLEIGIIEENTLLKSWYLKMGFVPTGTEKFDFFPFTCGYLELAL